MKITFPKEETLSQIKKLILPEIPSSNHRQTLKNSTNDAESSSSALSTYKKVANYLIGGRIGEGAFAKVRIGLHLPTKQKVAVKIVNKEKAKKDKYMSMNLHREGKLLQMVCHPNVVQILDILETGNNYYLVTEHCEGGDLIDVINKQGSLPEQVARKYLKQVVSAVAYLHKRRIVHRDLKIENILLDGEDNLKIIDFGLSNVISPAIADVSHSLSTQCGSPAYAAPELLAKQSYGPKVDVWSIGVIAYCMVVGKLPFIVKPFNLMLLCKKMIHGEINPFPNSVSYSCRSFIQKLLNPFENQRPTIYETMREEWLCSCKCISKVIMVTDINSQPELETQNKPNQKVGLHNRINFHVIKEMKEDFDFQQTDIIQSVQKNRPGPILTTYHLLVKRNSLTYEKNTPGESNEVTSEKCDKCGVMKRIQRSSSSSSSNIEETSIEYKNESTKEKLNTSKVHQPSKHDIYGKRQAIKIPEVSISKKSVENSTHIIQRKDVIASSLKNRGNSSFSSKNIKTLEKNLSENLQEDNLDDLPFKPETLRGQTQNLSSVCKKIFLPKIENAGKTNLNFKENPNKIRINVETVPKDSKSKHSHIINTFHKDTSKNSSNSSDRKDYSTLSAANPYNEKQKGNKLKEKKEAIFKTLPSSKGFNFFLKHSKSNNFWRNETRDEVKTTKRASLPSNLSSLEATRVIGMNIPFGAVREKVKSFETIQNKTPHSFIPKIKSTQKTTSQRFPTSNLSPSVLSAYRKPNTSENFHKLFSRRWQRLYDIQESQ